MSHVRSTKSNKRSNTSKPCKKPAQAIDSHEGQVLRSHSDVDRDIYSRLWSEYVTISRTFFPGVDRIVNDAIMISL